MPTINKQNIVELDWLHLFNSQNTSKASFDFLNINNHHVDSNDSMACNTEFFCFVSYFSFSRHSDIDSLARGDGTEKKMQNE